MAEKEQPQQPMHRVYSVIKREDHEDYWLNLDLAFPHKDGKGFNILLHAFPLDGEIVWREIADDESEQQPSRQERNGQQQRRGH